jgi:peptidoglycan/xylan/chitin deacetylase (PgdA/CDA1 family)
MFRSLMTLLSPSGSRARLTILTFHRVLPEPDALFPELPTAMQFRQQMEWVKRWFNVLPLDEAAQRLKAGSLPARAMALTFDDGYSDNDTIAAPILSDLGLSATFFIATSFLQGGCMWNDCLIEAVRRCPDVEMDFTDLGLKRYSVSTIAERRRAIASLLIDAKYLDAERRSAVVTAVLERQRVAAPTALMMNDRQVKRLRSMGMNIGAHTVTHPILTRIDSTRALQEIADSRDTLQELLGQPIRLFAYPNGMPRRDYGDEHVAMVKRCGFHFAVTTAPGSASARSDPLQLPRFAPWDHNKLRYAIRLATNLRLGEPVLA